MKKKQSSRKSAKFSLALALQPASNLHASVEPGLGAMKSVDRNLIAPSERQKIGDSLDLDAATAAEMPQDHRWDYLLSVTTARKLIAVEPHTATNGEVKVLIKKKQNALAYLRNHLQPPHEIVEWYWVTHGRTGFSRMDRQVRALSQNGISFSGRSLRNL